MIITHNIPAMNALQHSKRTSGRIEQAAKRLSSGYRILSAADDAAGLCISEKMRAQIRGLKQASKNAQDGISLIQTAEGGANEIHSILQRMNELTVQAANGTNTEADKSNIQSEINQLLPEIDRIVNNTEFNTLKLLDGTLTGTRTGSVHAPGSSSSAGGDVYKQKLSWSGGSFWLNDGQGLTIDYFDGTSNQSLTLKAAYAPNYKDGIILEPANGDLIYMVEFMNDLINYPVGRGGKLEYFLDRFHLQVDPEDDHTLMITAKSGEYKITDVSCIAGSPISNAGALEKAPAGNLGTAAKGLILQIGANTGQTMEISIDRLDTKALGISSLNIMDQASAGDSLTRLTSAIKQVSKTRSRLGAYQNRLEAAIRNLDNTAENLSGAQSRIRDADMAEEMVAFSVSSLLLQTAHAMLAQTNQMPERVLMLLNS